MSEGNNAISTERNINIHLFVYEPTYNSEMFLFKSVWRVPRGLKGSPAPALQGYYILDPFESQAGLKCCVVYPWYSWQTDRSSWEIMLKKNEWETAWKKDIKKPLEELIY